MKRGVLLIAGCLMLMMGMYVCASVPVTVIKLQKIKPADTYFTGEIEAINKGIFSFENPGVLQHVCNLGDYVFASIKTEDGKVVRKGTVIAQQETDRLEYELKAAKMQKKIAEAEFFNSKKDYERAKRLASTRAIPEKEFLDLQTELYSAKMDLDKAHNDVLKAEYNLHVATIVAPFSGIVTKVLKQTGARAGDGDDIIEVTQMTPLLIKIPFPSDIVDSFKEGTTVEVYPPGDLDFVYAWSCTSITNDMVYAYVHNSVVPTIKLTPEQHKMKRVYEFFPVLELSETPQVVSSLGKVKSVFGLEEYPNPLAVPIKAIRKDNNGSYVLKVKDERFNLKDPDSNLLQFKVKKVYIKLGNIKREVNLGLSRDVEIVSLKDPKDLGVEDIVLMTAEEGIKDGETVVKETVRWKFLPGQAVKVAIPTLSPEGIYVPQDAIINQATGDNYVYIVENGKAKLVHIHITGRCSGYNCIIGDGIKPGAEVIILTKDNEYKDLYDGANVQATVLSLPGIERIQHKRVDKLVLSETEIAKTYYSK